MALLVVYLPQKLGGDSRDQHLSFCSSIYKLKSDGDRYANSRIQTNWSLPPDNFRTIHSLPVFEKAKNTCVFKIQVFYLFIILLPSIHFILC